MWFFDGEAWPGWVDYLGLALTLAGFVVAIIGIFKNRRDASRATKALTRAQTQVSQRALLAVVPQFQSVVQDLDFALSRNSPDVAHRALVRYGLVAREAAELIRVEIPDREELALRLLKSSDRAVDSKVKIVSTQNPDLTLLAKAITKEVSLMSQEMAQVASALRNTVEEPLDV